jgi:nickel-dependent lactate racemase
MPAVLVEALLDQMGEVPVRVRIANGTHRRIRQSEQRLLLGRAWGKAEVGDRDCDDPGAHATVGGWARLDSHAAAADALVLMGPVSFHYLAGFGGGGKLIAPGLVDRATAEQIHSACLAPSGGRHPSARAGVREGNPLRQRIEQVCRLAPPQFFVLPVLDSQGRVTHLFAGERAAAFAAACAALEAGWSVPCARYSTLVVSAGGAPYDIDFVQAHKALEAASAACKPGGTLVLVAQCAEGLPPRHRAFLEKNSSAARMEAALREQFDIAAHTVWAAREKAERFRIIAVTRMERALVEALGMEWADSLQHALDRVALDDAALLPFGARFLPRPNPSV